MIQFQKYLITANGKITCLRCMAKSKRTGLQCGRPAMRLSKTKKCNFHGGKSTGPKTAEGRIRIGNAHFVHGNDTVQMRVERQQKNLWFAHIEDVMHLLNMTPDGRTRGQKPTGYKPIRTLDDALQWVIDDSFNSNRGSDKGLRNNLP